MAIPKSSGRSEPGGHRNWEYKQFHTLLLAEESGSGEITEKAPEGAFSILRSDLNELTLAND